MDTAKKIINEMESQQVPKLSCKDIKALWGETNQNNYLGIEAEAMEEEIKGFLYKAEDLDLYFPI